MFWYLKAADQNYAKAQLYIGMMYVYAEGVLRDIGIAIEWYKKAADNGNLSAQMTLYTLGIRESL